MARPLRLEFPGAFYHLTSRGNARAPIFLDDDDRRTFHSVLSKVIGRFEWHCHAYCLMTNHYHLLIETTEANLSRGMRQLNGIYTQRFNRRHDRVGHVFQGRFKAIVVERDRYLLELCRYVVLNPVRARLVKDPKDYPWSSYRATAGLEPALSFLTTDWVLAQFGERKGQTQRAYRDFVQAGIGQTSPWESLQGQVLLGSESFIEQLKPYLDGKQSLRELPKRQRLVARPPLAALLAGLNPKDRAQRDQTIRVAHLEHGYTLAEIAAGLGLHYSTISKAIQWK